MRRPVTRRFSPKGSRFMAFSPEPAHTHGLPSRTAVLMVNLGTPSAPTPAAVRRYLRQFLSDPRVVEIPGPLWWVILHAAILPWRPRMSSAKYAAIWTDRGSPLMVHSQQQALLLRGYLGERGIDADVVLAMRYGEPSIGAALGALATRSVERVLLLPMYPQYSATTTASALDELNAALARRRNVPEVRWIKHFHDDLGYIEALAESVRHHGCRPGRPQDRGGKLVMSFHGVPKRVLKLGAPYHCECEKTARLLAEALKLSPDEYVLTFQSRFGRAEWLGPYT